MRTQAFLSLLSFTPIYVQEYFNVTHNILNHLGSISPYHRARHHAPEVDSELPNDCTVDQVMLVSCNSPVVCTEMTRVTTR